MEFVATCMDLNGMKTLAEELHRQDMDDVVLSHPNTYNQQFVADAGDLFEGDYVSVQYRPYEADAEGTALEDYLHWMEETGSELTRARDDGVDQRQPRVRRAAGGRPGVRSRQGHRGHQRLDGLDGRRPHRAGRLGARPTRPSPTTPDPTTPATSAPPS